VSQDPNFWRKHNLTNPQSQNSYSYAESNPVNKRDPDGLKASKVDVQAIIQSEIKRSQQQFFDRVNSMTDAARAEYYKTIGLVGGGISDFNAGFYKSLGNPFASFGPSYIGNGGQVIGITAFWVSGTSGGAGGTAPKGVKILDSLSDATLVCRGGGCTVSEFLAGTGVTKLADDTLSGVSVFIGKNGESAADLLGQLPARFNGQGGMTTLGEIRGMLGSFTQTGGNPLHFELSNLNVNQLVKLFTGQ
jgi:hypothetical protein